MVRKENYTYHVCKSLTNIGIIDNKKSLKRNFLIYLFLFVGLSITMMVKTMHYYNNKCLLVWCHYCVKVNLRLID